MDKLISMAEYHTLRMIEERLAPAPMTITVGGQPRQINMGKRWDFWVAIADSNAAQPEFDALIASGYIEQLPGLRTYDDWRKHFPEYHYQITEKGRAVLDNPRQYVEPNPYTDGPKTKPDEA